EGRFFCFFFLVKKRKVLKVLWFWSALPTASQSTHFMNIKYSVLYFTWKWLPKKRKNASHLCHLKRSDLQMSYAVCRMQKVKSAGLKGMQLHNQRERESRTNEDIDRERTHENYDMQNDENINYNEIVKDIIDSQKIGTQKQKRFFEESYKLFSERYGKQNIAYATVHNDEQTPHMHLGVVPMRDGKLQGKNVFNRQELLWLQDKFPEHMKKQGFELKRGERGS